MNLSVEYNNKTISASHIQALLSIISIMSNNFIVRSFTVVTDLDLANVLHFQKVASEYFFEVTFVNSIEESIKNVQEGYIIIQNPGFELQKIMKERPLKLTVEVFITDETILTPEFTPEVVIPPTVSYFVVFLSKNQTGLKNSVRGKCFRIHKPNANYTTKVFPLMLYGGLNETKWYWHDERTNWNSYEKDILNMSEVTVVVGLASQRAKNVVTRNFLSSKNSFFWRVMADFLKFRMAVHVEYITPQAIKNVTSIYLKLLLTGIDGLGVLPVMTAERAHQSLEFLITGLDSRYHLMVRSPQYIYSWQSTVKPFTPESWLCLALTILLIAIVLKIVIWGRSEPNSTCPFVMVFGFICSQGSSSIPTHMSGRLVCYTALLFSIVIYQFYTSNFCSLLSTKEVSLPFTSLEELISKKTHSLYIHPDTAIYTHILKAKSGVFKKLYDDILKKDPYHQLKTDNREKALEKVCKGTGAILGLPYQTIYLDELACALVPVNSGYFPTSVATTIRKNFPFKSQFKFVHLRLLEAGVTHKFKEKFLDFKEQRATKADVTNEPVSLNHVAFPFVFYAAFVVFSTLVFCFEFVFFKSFRKTNKHFSDGNHFLRGKQFRLSKRS